MGICHRGETLPDTQVGLLGKTSSRVRGWGGVQSELLGLSLLAPTLGQVEGQEVGESLSGPRGQRVQLTTPPCRHVLACESETAVAETRLTHPFPCLPHPVLGGRKCAGNIALGQGGTSRRPGDSLDWEGRLKECEHRWVEEGMGAELKTHPRRAAPTPHLYAAAQQKVAETALGLCQLLGSYESAQPSPAQPSPRGLGDCWDLLGARPAGPLSLGGWQHL